MFNILVIKFNIQFNFNIEYKTVSSFRIHNKYKKEDYTHIQDSIK